MSNLSWCGITCDCPVLLLQIGANTSPIKYLSIFTANRLQHSQKPESSLRDRWMGWCYTWRQLKVLFYCRSTPQKHLELRHSQSSSAARLMKRRKSETKGLADNGWTILSWALKPSPSLPIRSQRAISLLCTLFQYNLIIPKTRAAYHIN